jgi:hypothetical protein
MDVTDRIMAITLRPEVEMMTVTPAGATIGHVAHLAVVAKALLRQRSGPILIPSCHLAVSKS